MHQKQFVVHKMQAFFWRVIIWSGMILRTRYHWHNNAPAPYFAHLYITVFVQLHSLYRFQNFLSFVVCGIFNNSLPTALQPLHPLHNAHCAHRKSFDLSDLLYRLIELLKYVYRAVLHCVHHNNELPNSSMNTKFTLSSSLQLMERIICWTSDLPLADPTIEDRQNGELIFKI